MFEDEGHSGATLVRPALEALRDLAAQGCVDVVLCYSPDRLARKFAYQALLIEEFARAGVRVEFVKGPRGDSPEDQLLVQFQGMFAEYEKAQLMERYRRGKAHRARTGSVNVLSGAPFGYRYLRKTDRRRRRLRDHRARGGAGRGDVPPLRRRRRLDRRPGPLADQPGRPHPDRQAPLGPQRGLGHAAQPRLRGHGGVRQDHGPCTSRPGLNRVARLQGRSVPRAVKTVDRPREEWIADPRPGHRDRRTPSTASGQRLEDNKRFAARNTKVPSLLQGLAACSACGYGYYRTSTRTTNKKIYYYRCLGSDDYRYEGGRVCGNKPVRADYLDTVVWDHITALLADPALIRAEISKRLEHARTADPATRQRNRLELALAKATTAITAHDRGLLRAADHHRRTARPDAATCAPARPACAARSTRSTPSSPTATPTSSSPTTWKASSPSSAATPPPPTVEERQRVLRLLVKDVLIGPEKITIRHRIPARGTQPRRQPARHQTRYGG